MPLVDHKGKTVGLMGVIDTKPMDNVQIAESTLQIFAARAAAEIERKRFEEDLNAEKERLAVTLRSIGDGFIATDMDGNVAMINNVAERLTGWRQDQIMGKPLVEIFNILNERTRKPCSTMLDRIVETGSVVGTANHAIVVSREGVERLIEISAAPIRDKTNRKLGTVLVFRDITEKEHLEAERRKAEKLESLGVAAGGIAHDFNNLLTAHHRQPVALADHAAAGRRDVRAAERGEEGLAAGAGTGAAIVDLREGRRADQEDGVDRAVDPGYRDVLDPREQHPQRTSRRRTICGRWKSIPVKSRRWSTTWRSMRSRRCPPAAR